MTRRQHHLLAACLVLATSGVASADVSKEACIDSHSKAQDARDQGKITLARKLFLTCAQASCPSLVQGDCARGVDDLTRMQPTLSFAARDSNGNDLPDTTVYIDDVLMATRLDEGKPYEVDPGKRVVKFINGGKEQVLTIVVGAGEKSRAVTATFQVPKSGVPAVTSTPAGDASNASSEPPRPATPKVIVKRPVGAKVLLVGGGIIALGGVALGVVGLTQLPSNCTLGTHQCAAPPGDPVFDDASSAVRLSNTGWIVAGVGVAALAGGIVWYTQGKKTTTEERMVATPWMTSDSAGIAAIGRF